MNIIIQLPLFLNSVVFKMFPFNDAIMHLILLGLNIISSNMYVFYKFFFQSSPFCLSSELTTWRWLRYEFHRSSWLNIYLLIYRKYLTKRVFFAFKFRHYLKLKYLKIRKIIQTLSILPNTYLSRLSTCFYVALSCSYSAYIHRGFSNNANMPFYCLSMAGEIINFEECIFNEHLFHFIFWQIHFANIFPSIVNHSQQSIVIWSIRTFIVSFDSKPRRNIYFYNIFRYNFQIFRRTFHTNI